MLQSPPVRGIPDHGLCDVVFDMLERQGSLVDGQHLVPFFIKPGCQIFTEVTEAVATILANGACMSAKTVGLSSVPVDW